VRRGGHGVRPGSSVCPKIQARNVGTSTGGRYKGRTCMELRVSHQQAPISTGMVNQAASRPSTRERSKTDSASNATAAMVNVALLRATAR